MNSKILITVLVVIVLAGGGYLIWQKTKSDKATTANTNSSTQTTPNSTGSTPPASSSGQKVAATISYGDSGFSPATTTVKAGDLVAIKNDSKENLQMDSNPHPAHTDDTDLNVGLVAPGEIKTFTVTKTGTYTYHNHLDPSNTGKITVE